VREQGVPEHLGAWLTRAAKWRALDWLRRERRLERSNVDVDEASALDPALAPGGLSEDEPLRLMFACCHPKLPVEAQVALTLRCVAGLTTAEDSVSLAWSPSSRRAPAERGRCSRCSSCTLRVLRLAPTLPGRSCCWRRGWGASRGAAWRAPARGAAVTSWAARCPEVPHVASRWRPGPQ
jgi:RNA polymerase sigma-70 factor (ECF subfamily)